MQFIIRATIYTATRRERKREVGHTRTVSLYALVRELRSLIGQDRDRSLRLWSAQVRVTFYIEWSEEERYKM